tara:strand:+ start:58 stop:1233 length:1176 start_codon:yes stop_codon:yes gene_type:complete
MSKNSTYIMPTYGDRNLEFKKGQGCYLTSIDNNKYLDFGSGIAVNSLGHCHPRLVKALQSQSSKLWHISNLYYNSIQEEYAKLLCLNSFAEKIFFTNSGVESIEAGIKVIKSYHHYHNNVDQKNIITFEGAFHGRTFAALSAQQNEKYSKGFEPLLSGFIKIPFNDIDAVKKNINKNTAAIMIEPIQGEGGIRPANLKFLHDIKKICEENNLLFFLDEVQSGFGRSGKLFAHEWANFEPDIVATAKGIGSGFPMGACLATNKASIGMTKGVHGSTYAGNPLAMSVGIEVIKIILEEGFLENVIKQSNYLWNGLKSIEAKYEGVTEIRGAGLLLGIQTKMNNEKISNKLIQNKLLCVPAADNIIRLAPPLIVSKKEIDKALQIIDLTFKENL